MTTLKSTAKKMGATVSGSNIKFKSSKAANQFERILKEDDYIYTRNGLIYTIGYGEVSLTIASLGEPKKATKKSAAKKMKSAAKKTSKRIVYTTKKTSKSIKSATKKTGKSIKSASKRTSTKRTAKQTNAKRTLKKLIQKPIR